MVTTRQQETTGGSFLRELFSVSVYKRNQGKVSRQLTFAAVLIAFLVGVWRLSQLLPIWFGGGVVGGGLDGSGMGGGAAGLGADLGVVRFVVPAVLAALGAWFCYRLVNVPRFADFLIAVESEMTKVSWPTKDEVVRSSIVVIFLIFALAAILAAYDLFWWSVLRFLQGFN